MLTNREKEIIDKFLSEYTEAYENIYRSLVPKGWDRPNYDYRKQIKLSDAVAKARNNLNNYLNAIKEK